MGFETVYKKLGVVIVEHALDEDRDLCHLDRAFNPVEYSDLKGNETPFVQPEQLVQPSSETGVFTGVPADLSDWLETHPVFIRLASRLLAAPASLVRIVASDETEPAHWLMPWRQVRQIAVDDRFRVAGFRNWTLRGGVWLVEPPEWVLEQSVILRVYLDDCRAFDGPVEVLTSSHDQGRLKRVEIADAAKTRRALTCLCDRGDILALSPLALRRRHRASSVRQRRVLELTYSVANLPSPLAWPSLTPELERAVEAL